MWRIEVQAKSENFSGNWAVFSLANPTDEQIDRLIVAPHYRMAHSGFFWPDLGSARIQSITPSEGFSLDRQPSANSDIFRITLNPGAVVTFVVELNSANLPQIYLWQPEAYKDSINSYTLYHGILLGISGLLALLLTVLFVVRGTGLFPATAAVAWAVLFYIGIDFNFLNKFFAVTLATQPIWRAGTEVALTATLFFFFLPISVLTAGIIILVMVLLYGSLLFVVWEHLLFMIQLELLVSPVCHLASLLCLVSF